ncbi:MAG TPA: hypothetical protein PKE21_14470 [Flavobacteriales bacterium]|nr:hypothetical protein [Flavobacteriales bacterium]HMR28684.1 hypothetical protein [Flavobacteriales bacterium]
MRHLIYTLLLLASLAACRNGTDDAPAGPGGWLKGEAQQKFDTLATHLRGFDVVMLEVGHRHRELYHAGAEGNWPLADYHVQKIRTTMELGLVRRPKRGASAQHFLDEDLPAMKAAIAREDSATFVQAYSTFTASCNACHAKEQVPHFRAKVPGEALIPNPTSN